MKRLFTSIVSIVLFILILSVTVVGIGNKKENNHKSGLEKFNVKAKDIIFNDTKKETKIKVYMTKEDKIQEMNIEEYVRGVVCGEMPAEFGMEALKAQAIAARTYALAHIESVGGNKCGEAKGADICDSVHCQVYMPKDIRMNGWPEKSRNAYWSKLTEAVKSTEGEVLTYNDKLVMEPYYFSTSSGRTENSSEIFAFDQPYLKSVESPGEESAKKYKTSVKLSYDELNKKINSQYPSSNISAKNLKNQIKILSKSQGGSVKELKIGNITMTGPNFRRLLQLNSANFNFKFNEKDIEIICKGYGHGVGMSQWGANVMSKAGKKYTEILTHYYSGVSIKRLW